MTPARVARQLTLATAVMLVAAIGASAAAAAAGAPDARLRVVSHNATGARLLLTVPNPPPGLRLSPTSIRVSVNGTAAAARATPVPGADTPPSRLAMLVVDTSGSMAGARLVAAKHAGSDFLTAIPRDVMVGLVAFSDQPRLLVGPTRSREAVRAALARLSARGETSLYDGIRLAIHALGTQGERTLVVLSDGSDTHSRVTRQATAAELRRSGVGMDAVSFGQVRQSLEGLTTTTGGTVTAASGADQLAAAFSAAARSFSTQLLVDVTLPPPVVGRAMQLVATISSNAGPISARASVAKAGASASAVAANPPSRSAGHGLPLRALGAVFLGLLLLTSIPLLGLERRTSSQERARRLVERFALAAAPRAHAVEADTSKVGKSGLARGALALAGRITDRPDRRRKLATRLARADVSLQPSEWLVVQSTISLVGGVLGALVFRNVVEALLLAVAVFAGCSLWLSTKGRRRLRAFEEHLPASLQLVAGSLSTGFSLAQALDGVVREGLEPVAGEMHRALAEARLGAPLEDALEHVAERMQSRDFSWVVMAIRIQREVGGNLGEVLLNTASMMRERAGLRRQVKALSAEGRLSAYILLALPLLLGLYMLAFRRAYIRPLYTESFGIGMLVVAVVLLGVGALWMRKTVAVEV